MTDYISRADAICEVLVNDGMDNIVDRINALPSADAVSREMREPTEEERASVKRYIDSISADVVAVVRCKDCSHGVVKDEPIHGRWCERFPLHDMAVGDMEYCSHGERAEQTEVEENDGFNTCNNHSNNADADYKPHGRLIDADALKAKWYEINDIDETDRGARFVGYTEIARLIDNAPTVEVGRPHGEWIVKDNEFVCSLCGNSVSFTRTDKGWILGRFCQSCGASMVDGRYAR